MAVQDGYGKSSGSESLVFAYDLKDTVNSFKGEPTVNYVPGTYGYSLYAYVSGPVDTVVLNEKNQSTTVKRYTITNAVNTARAAIRPSGLTTGVAYTFSFKWKYNGTTTTSPSIGVSAAKGNPEGGDNNNGFTSQTGDTVSIGNGWYLTTYTFVFSSNPTGASILTFGISTGSNTSYLGETFDIYEAQFEIKNHRTQYSNGTRSNTQGLLDLTGNSSIDLSNVSFDSNAQMTFDGTDDYVNIDTVPSVVANLNQGTIEMVFKWEGSGGNTTLFYIGDNTEPTLEGQFYIWVGDTTGASSAEGIRVLFRNASNQTLWDKYEAMNSSTHFRDGEYHHLVVTQDGSTPKIYIDNVDITSNLINWTSPTNEGAFFSAINCTRMLIGNQYYGGTITGGIPLNGEVPVFRIYNRELTSTEITNNYLKYKRQYGLT